MSGQDDPKERGEPHQRPGRSAEEREREHRRNRYLQDEYDERDDQENERGGVRRDGDPAADEPGTE